MDTGGNINPTDPNAEKNSSTPYFHSVHLNKTKASEEKVYFTNVKKESKVKNFKKKLRNKPQPIDKKNLIIVLSIIFALLILISFFITLTNSNNDETQPLDIHFESNPNIEYLEDGEGANG